MKIKNKIIAEIGSTHDGKLKLALKSIKKAAECGADYVKFQMHIAQEETLKNVILPYIYLIIFSSIGIGIVIIVGFGVIEFIKNYVFN